MNLHPLCSIFPAMSAPEFEALKTDIAAHGLREPVWTWRGTIIDGRHRWQACMDLGIEPMTREHDGDESTLVGFVLSMNLSRRHLSESQRAAVATKLASLAQGRQEQTGKFAGLTQPQAAELLNVGERSVRHARAVIERGAPELVAAVEKGEVSVSAAAVVAKTVPKEQQAALVAQKAVAKAAKQARAKPKPEPEPEPDHDMDEIGAELANDLEDAHKEILALQAQVKALTTGDTEAELARQIAIRQGIEVRLAQEMERCNTLDRQLRTLGALLEKLRRATGAKSNSDILARVKEMVG